MKLLTASAIASVVVLAACETPTTTTVTADVNVTPASGESLAVATGLPSDAVVAVSRTGTQYVVYYREASVTAEQLAAAPATICANTASTVFSADPIDTTTPDFAGGGVQRMTVTCS